MMLSIIYAKGKFSMLNIDQILSKHQDKKLNEILLKNCLIYEMINNNNKILTLKNNALIPNLFFYSDKQGLIYFDYILSEIYTNYKDKISLFAKDYFGIYDNDQFDNQSGNIVICFLIYFMMNKFAKTEFFSPRGEDASIQFSDDQANKSLYFNQPQQDKSTTYEEILTKMRMDYMSMRDEDKFTHIYSMIKNNQTLTSYFRESNIDESDSILSLCKNFKEMYYSPLLKHYAVCENCNINAQQITSKKFILHFPCYKILCANCLTTHKCINEFRTEVNNTKKDLNEAKVVFDFLPKIKTKNLYNYYIEQCEKVLNDSLQQSEKTKCEITNIERRTNTIIQIIENKINDEYMKVKAYLSQKNLITTVIGGGDNKEIIEDTSFDPIDKITSLISTKTTLMKRFLFTGVEEFNLLSQIKLSSNDISAVLSSEIARRFSVFRNEVTSCSSSFLVKYEINNYINEVDEKTKHSYISAIQRGSNMIYSYDIQHQTHSSYNLDSSKEYVEILPGTKWYNLKNYLMITGGGSSKKSYLYNSNNNSIVRLPDMIYKHSNHAMISIDNFVYVLSGANSTKVESFNILNWKWKMINELPKPISKASLAKCNMDLYIFFGEFYGNKEMMQSSDILRCRLYAQKQNWEILNVIYTVNDFIPINLSGNICMDKGVLLIGGFRLKEKGFEAKCDERYWFNYEDLKFSKINEKGKNKEGVIFEEGILFDVGDGVYMNWGDNFKIVKTSQKKK